MPTTTPLAPYLFDQFLPYDYKQILSDRWRLGLPWMAPTWVGEHRRRLQAYTFLQAYRDNAARAFVQVLDGEDFEARKNRREYGDGALFIEQVRSALLGDQQSIVVTDADKYNTNDAKTNQFQAAAERQDLLRQWAKDEELSTKLIETERDAVSYGDGLYTLSWDAAKERPVLTNYDPGNYFPVLDSISNNDYPTKVHIAWELTKDEAVAKGYDAGQIVIHRITYELLPVDDGPVLPWNTQPATSMCFMSESESPVSVNVRTPDDLTEEQSIYMVDETGTEINKKNLGIDFIPVIHIPNTVAKKEHYGKALLAPILQILDDIQLTDSDLQASAAITGGPMLALSGESMQGTNAIRVGPNEAIQLGPNGRAEMLSGEKGLDSLAKYRDDLLERASVNGRVPAAILGRVDPGKVQAGIILKLSSGPLAGLIDEMRIARKDKYRILLRFTQRFFLLNGMFDGDVIDADLVFGSYLPADRTGTVTDVVAAFNAGLISRATAMKMLQEVGVPIEDIGEEIQTIDKRDFAAAVQLREATGNDAAVGDFLGVEVKEQPIAPLGPKLPPLQRFPKDPQEGSPPNEQQPV